MDYKEAYKLIKQKFPNKQAGGYIFFDGLFVFPLFPIDKKLSKEELEYYDDSWSVDSNTKKIEPYGMMTGDPVRLMKILSADKAGTLVKGTFNEKDIL